MIKEKHLEDQCSHQQPSETPCTSLRERPSRPHSGMSAQDGQNCDLHQVCHEPQNRLNIVMPACQSRASSDCHEIEKTKIAVCTSHPRREWNLNVGRSSRIGIHDVIHTKLTSLREIGKANAAKRAQLPMKQLSRLCVLPASRSFASKSCKRFRHATHVC